MGDKSIWVLRTIMNGSVLIALISSEFQMNDSSSKIELIHQLS